MISAAHHGMMYKEEDLEPSSVYFSGQQGSNLFAEENIALPASYSFSFWAKTKTSPTAGCFVKIGHQQTGSGASQVTGSGVGLGVGSNNINTASTGTNLILLKESQSWNTVGSMSGELDKWNHYAVVVNGSYQYCYVNGVRRSTFSGAPYSTAPQIYFIGGYMGDPVNMTSPRFFNGNIVRVAMWNAALTDDEVEADYADGKAFPSKTGNLWHLWPLFGRNYSCDMVGGLNLSEGAGGVKLSDDTPFPYDAEIEYLESTGGQYVDTSYSLADNMSFGSTFMPLNDIGRWVLMFGWRNGSYQYQLNYNNQSGGPGFAWDINSTADNNGGVCEVGRWYNAKCLSSGSSRQLVVNGTTVKSSSIGSMSRVSVAYLFGSNVSGSYENRGQCLRVSDAWIKNTSGKFVRKLRPVRIGGEGMFYDRASGSFYRNAGTGSFVLGYDRPMADRAHYDSVVEYASSTGTQYVDTEIVPKFPDDLTYQATVSWSDTSTRKIMGRQGYFYFGVVSNRFQPGLSGTSTVNVPMTANQVYSVETRFRPTSAGTADPLDFKVDSSSGSVSVSYSAQPSDTAPVWIFKANNDSSNVGTSRVYSFRIIRSGNTLRDYVPVRLGTRGYLYDRVSDRLFGKGDLSVGADVKPYDA